jgi:propionyl-CoA carboxylase alpha chain
VKTLILPKRITSSFFIGPKSKAIHIMGSKLAAKEAVKAYNIPMVPGLVEAITDIEKTKGWLPK